MRPTTVKITYEVREVARIEPAPHLFTSSYCVRCRCARLTILLLLCDAQANDYPDEPTRLQMLAAEPFGVLWPSECPAARASELATARLAHRSGSRSVRSALVWAYRGVYARVRRLDGAAVRS